MQLLTFILNSDFSGGIALLAIVAVAGLVAWLFCRIHRKRIQFVSETGELLLHLKKINRKLDYYCALEREHSIEQAKMNT